jgi:hypothetical protein
MEFNDEITINLDATLVPLLRSAASNLDLASTSLSSLSLLVPAVYQGLDAGAVLA